MKDRMNGGQKSSHYTNPLGLLQEMAKERSSNTTRIENEGLVKGVGIPPLIKLRESPFQKSLSEKSDTSTSTNATDDLQYMNISDNFYLAVSIHGDWLNCDEDLEVLEFFNGAGGVLAATVTCPTLSGAYPEMFCPAICAGRSVYNYNYEAIVNGTNRPNCECFGENEKSIGYSSILRLNGIYILDKRNEPINTVDNSDLGGTWSSIFYYALFGISLLIFYSTSREHDYKRIKTERDDAKVILSFAKKELSTLEEKCERLQIERNDAMVILAQTEEALSTSEDMTERLRQRTNLAVSKADEVVSTSNRKYARLRIKWNTTNAALNKAEKAVSKLEGKCRRLMNERDAAKDAVDDYFNGDLSSKSQEDLESMEKKIRPMLDRIVRRKEKLLQEKLSEEAEKQLCVICQSEPKTVLLWPCKHLCCCQNCSEQILRQCPLCRQVISRKITNVYS